MVGGFAEEEGSGGRDGGVVVEDKGLGVSGVEGGGGKV